MPDTITAAALADLLGVNTRSIRDLAKRDIIVRAGADYVLGESVRRYCAHLRKLATGRGGEAAITSATAEPRGPRRTDGNWQREPITITQLILTACCLPEHQSKKCRGVPLDRAYRGCPRRAFPRFS